MFSRLLDPLLAHSFYIFGPRGTGKSTLLKKLLGTTARVLWIDLLDFAVERHYQRYPEDLKRQILADPKRIKWVVIDEVQRAPRLLDVAHQLIESSAVRFALTGSSARKLRRGAANLLAGRAFLNHLHPLTFIEIGQQFRLESALSWGTLPQIFQFKTNAEKTAYLQAYTLSFLKEEIKAEQIIRKLDPFSVFLEIAAQANGEIINASNISRDVGVSPHTIQSYFQILDDTLIGFFLPAFHRSVRKQQSQSPKFYFFDSGVCRTLQGTLDQTIKAKTYGFGRYFEGLVILELMRLNDYYHTGYRLSYLRTKDGAGIDLILHKPGRPLTLIEIKSTDHVDERDTQTLLRFTKDFGVQARYYVFSLDPVKKRLPAGIQAMFWQDGIQAALNRRDRLLSPGMPRRKSSSII